jgi:ring-1,2-phenylacetyl-CoA epoxidase subunit PaaA
METFDGVVRGPEEFRAMPDEYQQLVHNILTIHTVSELYGADHFYPSVQLAPTPRAKWNMARIVMEEYGHHLRFARLQEDLGVDTGKLAKAPLSIFEPSIDSWTEQMMFLAIVDRAARLQFEEFCQASYLPLREAAQRTLKEEVGHAEYGRSQIREICSTADGREEAQRALEKWFPAAVGLFGRSGSRKSEAYRKWGIKRRTNDEMRVAFLTEGSALIEREWGLRTPALSDLDRYTEYGG